MTPVLLALLAFIVNGVVGAGVLAWLDLPKRYDGALFAWAKSAPPQIREFCHMALLQAWPLVLARCLLDMREERET